MFVMCNFFNYSFAEINSGLVAHYRLDGNAKDSSGNGLDGESLNGVSWIDGVNGNAANFDGIDDYIDISSITSIISETGTGTISLWFKRPEPKNYNNVLFHYYDGSNKGGYICIGHFTDYMSNESLSFVLSQRRLMLGYLNNEYFYMDDKWHHVAVVMGKYFNALYIDGVKKNVYYRFGSEDTGNILWDNIKYARLGRHFDFNKTHFYKGAIDDVRIYDRALLEYEIQSLHNKPNTSIYNLNFHHIDNQIVGEPFNVSIDLIDELGNVKDINGLVKLSAGPRFTPYSCQMNGGQTSCNLSFLGAKDGVELKAIIDTSNIVATGGSNDFNVKSKYNTSNTLKIKILDNKYTPIHNAKVQLLTSTIVGPKYTNENGYVSFDDVPMYDIVIFAEKQGYLPNQKYIILKPPLTSAKLTLTEKNNKYVVFVPGIFGSKSWGPLIPKMPKNYARSSNLKIHNLPFAQSLQAFDIGWVALKAELEKDGYTIKEFPYDWRLYPTDSKIDYGVGKMRSPVWELNNLIEKIKTYNPNSTIDLVAHSLGGFVLLSYLKEYQIDNINKVVFVGSPIKGTLNFYIPTVFGDILKNDSADITDSMFPTNLPGFTSQTINALHLVENYSPLFYSVPISHPIFPFYHINIYLKNPNKIKEWLNESTTATITKIGIPSFANSVIDCPQTVHISDNLELEYNNTARTYNNTFINDLLDKEKNIGLQLLLDENNARVFYATSDGYNTVRQLNHSDIKNNAIDKETTVNSLEGDGLTLKSSAKFNDLDIYFEEPIEGKKHRRLIQIFKDKICAFLSGEDENVIAHSSFSDYLQNETQSNSLYIQTYGYIYPLVNISDQKYGYDLSLDQLFKGADLIDFTQQNQLSDMHIEGFSTDTFTLKLTGEVMHDFFMNIQGHINNYSISFNETMFFHGNPIVLYFNLSTEGQLTVTSLPEKPTSLESKSYGPGNKLTQISWMKVEGAVSYNVYLKTEYDARYTLIQEIDGSTNFYNSNVNWNGEPHYFCVSSVDDNGNESFLTYQVTNREIKQYYVPEFNMQHIPAINLLLFNN